MITNIIEGGSVNISLYNENPLSFIFFDIEDEKNLFENANRDGKQVLYNISAKVININQDNIGFMINKSKDESYQELYINDDGSSQLYASFCLEQDTQSLSKNITDIVDIEFKVSNYNNNNDDKYYYVKVFRNFNDFGTIYPSINKTINENSSFMVLRTNPKLSGNIKIVVSPDYNLFIDTFPVTPILSKSEVRKREVSAMSSYSKDVYSIFSKVPASDIFKMNDYDTYDISLPKSSYKDQYTTTYNYGARELNDEMYGNDYSILAPLWIEGDIPEYFALFRIDGAIPLASHTDFNSVERVKEYMENSTIIKSWCLKPSTPLGKYLHTHKNDIKNINSNIYITFDDDINNSWSGIPLKYGIMSELSETTYEFNNIAKHPMFGIQNPNSYSKDEKDTLSKKNFTELNNYLTEGFSRNNILCPNLVNLQFNFNDDDVEDFSMNRYFGLYLSANELIKFNYYDGVVINEDKPTVLNTLVSMDNEGNDKYDIISVNNDRVFGVSNGDTITRVNSIKEFLNGNIDNRISSKISSTLSDEINVRSFITISFKDNIFSGEHFNLYLNDITLNFIASNTNILKNEESYDYSHTDDGNYTMMFGVEENDINSNIKSFYKALLKFKYIGKYEVIYDSPSNSISIYSQSNSLENAFLEYITSEIAENCMFNTVTEISDFGECNYIDNILFYGEYKLDDSYCIIKNYNDMGDFAIHGNRKTYKIPFLDLGELYKLNTIEENKVKIFNNNVYKYNNKYIKFTNVKDILKHGFDGMEVLSPFLNHRCVITSNKIEKSLNSFTIYELEQSSLDLYSICEIKDFDFTVYSKIKNGGGDIKEFKSEYFFKRESDSLLQAKVVESNSSFVFTIPNSYKIMYGSGRIKSEYTNNKFYDFNVSGDVSFGFNTFSGNVMLEAYSNVLVVPSNISETRIAHYSGYDNSLFEEDYENYFESNYRLKYGLTSPYVCKWVMDGNDCRSNKLALKTNSFLFGENISSNFIPYDEFFFKDELAYPVFKHTNIGVRDSNSYVFYDINDKFKLYSTNEVKSLKELYLSNDNINVFNKILFYNFNDEFNTSKYSSLSYNKFYNTLETIFKGMKISLKLSENMYSNKDLDEYLFSIIISNSGNTSSNKPFEVFVDNIYKTVLVVWYSNSSNISYTNRNDRTIKNKSFFANDKDDILNELYPNDKKYTYSKAVFNINTSNSLYSIFNLTDSDINSDDNKYFYQSAFNRINNLNYFTYIYNGIYSSYSGNDKYMSKGVDFSIYNNFSEKGDKFIGVNSFGKKIVNKSYTFNNNDNQFLNSLSIDEFKNFIKDSDNYTVYVINKDNTFSSDDLNIKNVFNIDVHNPKLYNNIYTHSGWYKPLFYNLSIFSMLGNDSLSDVFGIDLSISNTKLYDIKNFPQLWFYKVNTNISETDIKNGIAIDFRDDFSPLFNQWDNKYYTNYENGEVSKVNGVINPYSETSMFGSKLLKLPKYISLSNWNDDTAHWVEYAAQWTDDNVEFNNILLKFNISKALKEFFFNPLFISNWDNISHSNKDDIINNFIDKSIINKYSKNIENLSVNIYNSAYDGNYISFSKKENSSKVSDSILNTYLDIEYEDYVYNIVIPIEKKDSYHVEIIIK